MKTNGNIPQFSLSMAAMEDCTFFKYLLLSSKRKQLCKMSFCPKKQLLNLKKSLNMESKKINLKRK